MAEPAHPCPDEDREIIVVEPRPIVLEGMRLILEQAAWQVMPTASEAVFAVPAGVGMALVALVTRDPEITVEVLAARGRTVAVYGGARDLASTRATAIGAVAFVPEWSDPRTFVAAVEALHDRPSHAGDGPAGVAERRRSRGSSRAVFGLGALTSREMQVLEGLMAGLRPAQIAERDFVSVTTVRNQVQAILTKLGAHSQLEAVAIARREGWLRYSA